jgi:hypothetical protein
LTGPFKELSAVNFPQADSPVLMKIVPEVRRQKQLPKEASEQVIKHRSAF